MNISDYISIVGSIVTLGSMALTIYYASRSKSFSEKAGKAFDAISLNAVADRMKDALDHLRTVTPERLKERGAQKDQRFDKIRNEFDRMLISLPKTGSTQNIREMVGEAQNAFEAYESSLSGTPNAELLSKVRKSLQDAGSEISAINLSTHKE